MSRALLAPALLLALALLVAPRPVLAQEDSACVVALGGGCSCRDLPEPRCPTDSGEGGDSQDSADTSVVVEGGGRGCAAAPGQGLLGLLAALIALSRRRAAGVGLALLLARPAAAVDAQRLQDVDGGDFLGLQEPRLAGESAWRASLATSWARAPVVLASAGGETPYLDELVTLEPAFSLDIGRWFQLGVVWPQHLAWVLGAPGQYVPGDLGLRVAVPLIFNEPRALSATWGLQADLPRGGEAVLLGDRQAVLGCLALGRGVGELDLGLNLGLRLQEPTQLPGSTWGSRLELGIGLKREMFARIEGSVEALASGPLGGAEGGRALYPLELLGGLKWSSERGRAARVAAGMGLGSGLGAPALRLALAVEAEAPLEDQDQDGIVDVRDLCRERPEDRDRHRDQDGCPDPDNDRDQILDLADACPDEAELYNRFEDEDGCPDAPTVLLLTVRSASRGALEQATVSAGELAPFSVIEGEATELRVPPGSLRVRATAPGHEPAEQIFYQSEPGTYARELVLVPQRTGTLRLLLREPGGAPLAGRVEIDGATLEVPDSGLSLTLPVGEHALVASAPQHAPARETVALSFRGELERVLVLEPVAVDLADGRITLAGELGFGLDEATLRPEDLPLLASLAAWMQAHPEVLLLRVEGHADEVGPPAYNYDLSLRRAEAVRAALIARGVAPERLQTLGSGEAVRPRDERGALRRVEFLVLIWEEGEK